MVDFQTLLAGRTLGPPAGLMLRRSAFKAVDGFDPTSPRATEDLDIYLRLVREFPVYCHRQTIFEYRRHDKNSSLNSLNLLENCLTTLDRQWKYIEGNKEYEAAYRSGRKLWKRFFYKSIPYSVVAYLKRRDFREAWRFFLVGLRHSPLEFIKYIIEFPTRKLAPTNH